MYSYVFHSILISPFDKGSEVSIITNVLAARMVAPPKAMRIALLAGRKVRTITPSLSRGRVAGNTRPEQSERCEQRRLEAKAERRPPERRGGAPKKNRGG